MIWLIGKDGLLGSDVEKIIKDEDLPYRASSKEEVDIVDYKALEKYCRDIKLEWIINCAGYTRVDEAEKEEELAFKINRDGVRNIALLCFKRQVKLIHISTDYIFDGKKINEEQYQEDDKPNPINIYGKSKLAGEQEIKNIFNDYFILRTAWLYGANGPNFVSTMLRLFREKEIVKVVCDQWGTPTYSKDLARVIVEIVKRDSVDYGVYHYTNSGETSWFNFAREIYKDGKELNLIDSGKEVQILPVSTEDYLTLAMRPKNTILSKEKIKQVFHLELTPWNHALKEFLSTLS